MFARPKQIVFEWHTLHIALLLHCHFSNARYTIRHPNFQNTNNILGRTTKTTSTINQIIGVGGILAPWLYIFFFDIWHWVLLDIFYWFSLIGPSKPAWFLHHTTDEKFTSWNHELFFCFQKQQLLAMVEFSRYLSIMSKQSAAQFLIIFKLAVEDHHFLSSDCGCLAITVWKGGCSN